MQNSGPDAGHRFYDYYPKWSTLDTRLILSLYTELLGLRAAPLLQKFWQTLSQLVSHPHLLCDSESNARFYTALRTDPSCPAL